MPIHVNGASDLDMLNPHYALCLSISIVHRLGRIIELHIKRYVIYLLTFTFKMEIRIYIQVIKVEERCPMVVSCTPKITHSDQDA